MTVSDPAATKAPDAARSRDLDFEFTGNGWEYFKIWIVNVLLTILTLGVYSAWAKVRTQQYFYGNTLLDGASFRYTARPLTILKGRLIAVAAFIVFILAQEFFPSLAMAMLVAFLLAIPAIVVRGMAFRLASSMHRSVTFGFQRNYAQAYAVFMAPLLVLVVLVLVFGLGAQLMGSDGNRAAAGIGLGVGTAMLAYLLGLPFLNYLATQFYVNNSRYGDSAFAYTGGAGGFYKVYGLTLLIALGVALVLTAVAVLLGQESLAVMKAMQASGGERGAGHTMLLLSQGGLLLAAVPAYLLVFAYFQAKRFNLVYGSSVLAEHYGFRARLCAGGLAWLYVSNMAIILLTLGLGVAWAKVRSARYHLQNLDFIAAEDLNRFAAWQQERVSALGEQMGEVFDLEMGI